MTAGFSRRDYYRVLQVDPAAHPEVIQAAYRTLLRVLRRHPDLGGDAAEACVIIEAYRTLADPPQRQAYDAWLRAHAASPLPQAPARPLAPETERWVREALADWHEEPRAPFSSRFDVVLEAPAPSTDRCYVKGLDRLDRAAWPTLLTLVRAVGVARGSLLPSSDVILFAPRVALDVEAFLAEATHYCAYWAWNRRFVAVWTGMPAGLRVAAAPLVPTCLRRLLDTCPPGEPA
jgi:hypothetical protein